MPHLSSCSNFSLAFLYRHFDLGFGGGGNVLGVFLPYSSTCFCVTNYPQNLAASSNKHSESGIWRLAFQDLSQSWKGGFGPGLWSHVKTQLGKDPLLRPFTWLLEGFSFLWAIRMSLHGLVFCRLGLPPLSYYVGPSIGKMASNIVRHEIWPSRWKSQSFYHLISSVTSCHC